MCGTMLISPKEDKSKSFDVCFKFDNLALSSES